MIAWPPMRRRFRIWRTIYDAGLRGDLPPDWDADIPVFPADAKGMATRVASGKVMNAIAPRLPALIGGSADLDPSTYTALKGLGDFEPPDGDDDDKQGSAGGGWSYGGRNLHFGVREHGMGAILNGLAAHGGDAAVRRDISDFLRLHAPADPPRCPDGTARDPRVHPRQHRARRGRPHPSTGGATGRLARDSEADRDPARRCQRDRRRLASRAGNARSPGRVGAHAAGRAHARSQPLCAGRRPAPRCLCTGRCAGRQARA